MTSSHETPLTGRRIPPQVMLLAMTLAACTGGPCAREPAAASAAALHVQTPAPQPAPPPEAKPSADGEAFQEPHWVLGGARLMVAGRWLLNPATGDFTLLPYSTLQPMNGGGPLVLQTAFSPRGERIAVSDGQTVRQGPVSGPLEPPLEIPSFLPPSGSNHERQLRNAFFWLSEQQLGLYQMDLETAEEARCALLEAGSDRWSVIPTCPSASFFQVWTVESGPQGWLALSSGAEGTTGLSLVRYVASHPPSFAEPLSFSFSPEGEFHAQFATNAVRLHLTTPCVLEREQTRLCEGVDTQGPWRLYTWEGPGSRPTLRRQDLPSRAVPHPSGTRWAWQESKRLCVGELSGTVTCFTPPQ